MAFSMGLRQSLQARHSEAEFERVRGDCLEDILDRHLLAVERMAETELVTSILLLSSDGKRLYHGSGPNLPQSYREAIDGSEIGPRAGSCGTAAYLLRPVYVSDISSDPLWDDYRHLALPHGLRSCWSTPICAPDGSLLGTFAIYHRTATAPTSEELDAIGMITEHVAQAILLSRAGETGTRRKRPHLRLVGDNPAGSFDQEAASGLLDEVVRNFEALASDLSSKLARHAGGDDSEREALKRARDAALRGAKLTRRLLGRER